MKIYIVTTNKDNYSGLIDGIIKSEYFDKSQLNLPFYFEGTRQEYQIFIKNDCCLVIPSPLSTKRLSDFERVERVKSFLHKVLCCIKGDIDELFLILHASDIYSDVSASAGNIELYTDSPISGLQSSKVHAYCFHHQPGEMYDTIFYDDINDYFFDKINKIILSNDSQ